MSGILIIVGVAVGVAFLPLAMLMAMASLGLLIWSWGRIGRYFVNFGQWVGDWRNFAPITILGILVLLVLVVLWRFLLPQLAILWIMLLIVHVVISLTCLIFAAIAWTVWFHQWFWPKYKRWLWSVLLYLFGQGKTRRRARPAGRPRQAVEPVPGTEPATQRRPPEKRSALRSLWALMLGKPRQPAKSAALAQPSTANVQPPGERAPAKHSWFGTFWALMLGKPQPKSQQARPTRVRTTEQTLGPSGSLASAAGTEAATSSNASSPVARARVAKPAKRSWFGSFWALMLGKPSKSGQRKAQPERARAVDRGDRPAQTTAAADVKTGATARATAARSREKPSKRGFFAGIWNSIVRGVTIVVGLVILVVLRVVQKVREGIEWIRVRLNLD